MRPKMRFLFVLFVVLISCRSLSISSKPLVTNPDLGDLADRFPEVVRLDIVGKNDPDASYTCSGTFVSPSLLLTAAHCIFDHRNQRVEKVAYTDPSGRENIGNPIVWKKFNEHQPINQSMHHDLGAVEFANNVAPKVANFDPRESISVGSEVTLVGFGDTDATAGIGSGNKSAGRTVVNYERRNVFMMKGLAYTKSIESAGMFSSAGFGDSGGAIFNAKGSLVGVISAGSGTNHPGELKTFGVNLTHPDTEPFFVEVSEALCSKRMPPRID